jgi:Heavy metal binding domain
MIEYGITGIFLPLFFFNFKKQLIMKNVLIVILLLSIGVWSCGTNAEKGKPEQNATTSTTTEVKKDTLNVPVYICPMDADVTGKEGDKCSKCGMALVQKK